MERWYALLLRAGSLLDPDGRAQTNNTTSSPNTAPNTSAPARSVGGLSRMTSSVLAQAFYRLGRTDSAITLFIEFIDAERLWGFPANQLSEFVLEDPRASGQENPAPASTHVGFSHRPRRFMRLVAGTDGRAAWSVDTSPAFTPKSCSARW